MSLVLNEDQRLIQNSARDFFTSSMPVQLLRDIRDKADGDKLMRQKWQEMAELGWIGAIVSESNGGAGFSFQDLFVIIEESGRTVAPTHLIGTALMAAHAIQESGNPNNEAWLRDLVAGNSVYGIALDENSVHEDSNDFETHVSDEKLYGNKHFVLDGSSADVLIVAAKEDDGISLLRIESDRAGITSESQQLVDSRDYANVRFDGVQVEMSDYLTPPGGGDMLLEEILDLARVALSYELVGISDKAFEMAVEYLKERKQFDAIIGTFQALQHRCAHLFSEIELMRSAAIAAGSAANEKGSELAQLASVAKATASATSRDVTNEALQLHGGVGMTDEFDIGFYMKRARVAASLYGNDHFHTARFAALRGF